jgi:hypothetical protein
MFLMEKECACEETGCSVLEIGWTAEEGEGCHALLVGAAAITPLAVADDTLLSLKRPNKGKITHIKILWQGTK